VSSIVSFGVHGTRGIVMLVLVAAIVSLAATAPSHAITCTDRQQVCFRYCEKNYANAPRCRATCGELLSTCMSTGCWESKVTARQCGISKQ
jgi:hypothetical protein